MSTQTNCLKIGNLPLPLLMVTLFLSLLTPLLIALPAQAECIYEGETYQTGDTIGSLVCMPDGTWQPQ